MRSNPVIWEKLNGNFVMLKINVGDGNSNEEFMSGLPPVLGYPHMFVARQNGNLLHSQDTAEFLLDGKYSSERFLKFLDQWRPGDKQP